MGGRGPLWGPTEADIFCPAPRRIYWQYPERWSHTSRHCPRIEQRSLRIVQISHGFRHPQLCFCFYSCFFFYPPLLFSRYPHPPPLPSTSSYGKPIISTSGDDANRGTPALASRSVISPFTEPGARYWATAKAESVSHPLISLSFSSLSD